MKKLSVILLFVSALLAGGAIAEDSGIYINVGQGQVKKSLIALTPLLYVGTQASSPTHIRAGQDLYRVVYNDLSVSNFFTFIKPDAYLENPSQVGLRPAPGLSNGFNYKNWAAIGTEFLVRAAYQIVGDELSMESYVYHVPTAKMVIAKNYKGPTAATRRMAHTFSNDLLKALTGRKGMFLTKLVASGTPPGGNKEIYLMDWDGFGPAKITSHNSLTVSPTWANKGNKIAYTGWAMHAQERVRNPDLFVYDIDSSKRFLVSYRKGINSGANFLPGDTHLLLTLSKDGNADIYKMSVDGQALTQLTRGPNRAMNVEPAISPDGKTIAFSSDRNGRPHIFLMNLDGSNPRAITRAGVYNSSPVWSPDGKTIAFAGHDKDHFDIFTMSPDGTNLKRMTDARKANGKPSNNESPSWSPDGRHIVFASDRTGKSQIYVVSPDGTNERRITEDNYNWDRPKWSPFLE